MVPVLLNFSILLGDSLAEAAVSLSATRLPGMAAAVLQIFQLQPIVPQQQLEFLGPGPRAGQIAYKGPGAGMGFAFLKHGRGSLLLALSHKISGSRVITSISPNRPAQLGWRPGLLSN